MGQVLELAKAYAEARAKREALDKEAKEARAIEDELKAQLISEMSAGQMPSVKFDGLGRFVIKPVVRYDIADIDRLMETQMRLMIDNLENDRPISDGLLLQKRTAKGVIDELKENYSWTEQDLATRGLAETANFDLTFTRQK